MQATEFLTEKRKAAFRFFDANSDGLLTGEDFTCIADSITKETGASDEDVTKAREEWLKWFKSFQANSSSKEINEKEFVANCDELSKDMANYRKTVTQSASDMFDRLDLDKDGKITVDELSIFYRALSITDKDAISSAFSQLDKDGDGFLQRDELIEDMVRHFTDPKPETGKAHLLTVPRN